jgi:hypothetical protein
VVISIAAAVSSADAMINPVIMHLQQNSNGIKHHPDWSLADLRLDQFVVTATPGQGVDQSSDERPSRRQLK